MSKRDYYLKKDVVSDYDNARFSGKGGAYANLKEIRAVVGLTPKSGNVLEIAAGTGRFSASLRQRGQDVVTSDYSIEMLRASQKRLDNPLSRADAFNLPFKDGAFDSAVCIRFILHYEDMDSFLGEMARIVKPGGAVVFDTYRWSMQAVYPFSEFLDGQVYIHDEKDVIALFKKHGLMLEKRKSCFVLSPSWYRFMPGFVVSVLDALERKLYPEHMARTFWRARKLR